MDWLLARYGGYPSDWLRQPRRWVDRLLLLRNYRATIARGSAGD